MLPTHNLTSVPARRAVRRRASLAVAAVTTLLASLLLAPDPASATACSSTMTYSGTSYCVVTIPDLNAGLYPAGTRVVLHNVFVLSGAYQTRTLGSIHQCPAGLVCGALITWDTTTVTYKKGSNAPALYWWIDQYGSVSTTRALNSSGTTLLSYGGDPSYW